MPRNTLTSFFLILGCFSFSQVVINELDADTPGTDQLEFIELKSASPNFPLDGYVLVFFNASSTAPYSGTLSYYAIDLDGYSTDVNGIALLGNNQVVPSPISVFQNSTLQNGPDVVALYTGNATDFPTNTQATATALIDALAYSNSTTQPSAMMSLLGITVCTNENATSSVTTHSIQRKNDGTYEVKTPTPGMNNDGSGIVLNYISVTTAQTSYFEGDTFDVFFTASQPITTADLVLNFTLNNGNFTSNDFTGSLTVTIPIGQTSGQSTIVLTDDLLDEGDEELLIDVQPLPSVYVLNNDNIIVRIYDNDYTVLSFGKPTTPTYGLVTPSIPIGYYASLEGLSGAALKQELQNIIANPAVVRLHSYADIWEILNTSDQNPENSNQIWAIYREEPMAKIDQQNTSSIVGKWNREHIFCQSRGGFEVANGDAADGITAWTTTSAASTVDGVSDAHHIRAVNGQENSSRNNKNYGTVATSTVYAGPTGTQGSWQGDVARSLFYMAVRFDGLSVVTGDPSEYLPSSTLASGAIGDLTTLLSWNTSDPSDDFEMNRNNYIYTWQMNRNPFIDYPNLADYIFGASYGQPWSASLSVQNEIKAGIVVYPNPATNYLLVSGLEGKSTVALYTLTGQFIYCQDFQNQTKLDLALNQGVYLITITNQNQTFTKKIIVK